VKESISLAIKFRWCY